MHCCNIDSREFVVLHSTCGNIIFRDVYTYYSILLDTTYIYTTMQGMLQMMEAGGVMPRSVPVCSSGFALRIVHDPRVDSPPFGRGLGLMVMPGQPNHMYLG